MIDDTKFTRVCQVTSYHPHVSRLQAKLVEFQIMPGYSIQRGHPLELQLGLRMTTGLAVMLILDLGMAKRNGSELIVTFLDSFICASCSNLVVVRLALCSCWKQVPSSGKLN